MCKVKWVYIKEMLRKVDILCIQEHWLYRAEHHIIGELDTANNFVARSVDEDNHEVTMTMTRGYGGIVIIWKKDIDKYVKELGYKCCIYSKKTNLYV